MRNRFLIFLLLGILLAFGALYVYRALTSPKTTSQQPGEVKEYDPQFRKDGQLVILRTNGKDTVKVIDMEVADDEYEITTGLMYRSKMEINQGMLFVFPDVQMRSFWMKNTKIPLDIIFISEDQRIVTIQKNTVPYNLSSIPSSEEAKYVLEVNAGFSDRFGLQLNDRLNWKITP